MQAILLGAFGALLLSACATTGAQNAQATSSEDPFENFNRSVFAFNAGVDKYALAPAARTYETVTPKFGRDRVSDFFGNLGEPVTFINSALQGNDTYAADTLFRFLINSTVGIAGLWDPAEKMGVPEHDEDFGQTLAVWGAPSGPYLVVPFLGPSNPRDLFGTITDRLLDPMTWTEFAGSPDLDDQIAYSRTALGGLQARINLDEQIEALNDQPEPYTALRRIYSSQRQADARNGNVSDNSYDDLPDFDEFDDYDN